MWATKCQPQTRKCRPFSSTAGVTGEGRGGRGFDDLVSMSECVWWYVGWGEERRVVGGEGVGREVWATKCLPAGETGWEGEGGRRFNNMVSVSECVWWYVGWGEERRVGRGGGCLGREVWTTKCLPFGSTVGREVRSRRRGSMIRSVVSFVVADFISGTQYLCGT